MTLDLVAVGDSTVDVVVPLPRFLRGNEDSLHSTGMERHMGGSSNYLITASRLGLRVGVADCIGDDDLGAFYRTGLEAEGVDTSQLRVREGGRTTGCLVLLTSRGKHAYVGLEGVSGTYTPEELDEGYIGEARSFLMSGYPLAENPIASAVAKAMRTAKKAGRIIFFDPSPVADSIQPDLLREAVASTHTLILNEREMRLIASTLKLKPEPGSLLDLGTKRIVLKRGVQGCTFHTPSEAVDYSGFKVRVVDTTGAGDSFDAAIVYGTLRGWRDNDIATLANVAGAVKVGKKGAGRNVPTRAELVAFLSERGLALATEL
jgi:sugar/nucleoside kinase (ribokinase family)